MYPTLLALRYGKILFDYRSDRLQKAKQKATVYGYKGAMFPWDQMIQEKRQRQPGL
jgi:trehalose/maltose hydrolase-like predicted phosphorylase